jgi:uncharacterized membrane protein
MRKYFTTGLAILLPVLVTFLIIAFLINFLTKPFIEPTLGFLSGIFSQYQSLHFLQQRGFLVFLSKIVILLLLGGVVFFVGLIAKLFLVDYFIQWGNYFVHKVPFINKIYKACQDVIHSVFHTSTSFSQVVLVPFPTEKSQSIGFITGKPIDLQEKNATTHFVSVFVPGTPNPSVGFIFILKAEKLVYRDMKVDEAMKFVLSCGVASSKRNT